mmetsp:Transcript_28780/g.94527  ORF Transcript_28780/g.94527 Transcript_28780/m.94527 type:complete len:376 (-) Transcript_28780:380-1507(-)
MRHGLPAPRSLPRGERRGVVAQATGRPHRRRRRLGRRDGDPADQGLPAPAAARAARRARGRGGRVLPPLAKRNALHLALLQPAGLDKVLRPQQRRVRHVARIHAARRAPDRRAVRPVPPRTRRAGEARRPDRHRGGGGEAAARRQLRGGGRPGRRRRWRGAHGPAEPVRGLGGGRVPVPARERPSLPRLRALPAQLRGPQLEGAARRRLCRHRRLRERDGRRIQPRGEREAVLRRLLDGLLARGHRGPLDRARSLHGGAGPRGVRLAHPAAPARAAARLCSRAGRARRRGRIRRAGAVGSAGRARWRRIPGAAAARLRCRGGARRGERGVAVHAAAAGAMRWLRGECSLGGGEGLVRVGREEGEGQPRRGPRRGR